LVGLALNPLSQIYCPNTQRILCLWPCQSYRDRGHWWHQWIEGRIESASTREAASHLFLSPRLCLWTRLQQRGYPGNNLIG